MNANDLHDPIAGIEYTIHDLFNELHRRLHDIGADPNIDEGHSEGPMYIELASQVDSLHHDYTDLTS